MYVARISRRSCRSSVSRYFSTPSPSTQPSKPPSPLPAAPQPAQKVKLQPAPLKPSSLPPKSNSAAQQVDSNSSKPKPASKPPITNESSHELAPVQSSSSWNLVETFRITKQQTLEDVEAAYKEGVFAPRPEGAGSLRKGLHAAWEMGKFYFFGVGTIVTRQRDSLRIRRRTRNGDALVRTEHRMIVTQKKDVQKVIPFIFVALILEEAIPFIAILAPGTLPSTWLLPSQSRRIETRKDLKAADVVRKNASILRKFSLEASEGLSWRQIQEVGKAPEILCSLFRLPTSGFNFMLNYRLSKHLRFLAQDDALLQKEGNGSRLTSSQIDEALRERGFLLSQIPSGERLSYLQEWLRRVEGSSDEMRRLALVVKRY